MDGDDDGEPNSHPHLDHPLLEISGEIKVSKSCLLTEIFTLHEIKVHKNVKDIFANPPNEAVCLG